MREDRLALIHKRHPHIRTTSNFNEILSDKTIDAIIIATPTRSHFILAKQALNAHKHVWIEKPMTESVKQAKELITLAKKQKKIIHIDHIFIYTEAVSHIKTMIKKGELGNIYYFDSVRINLGLFQKDINVIWDLAPHDISIMLYLLNEYPKSVSAIAHSHVVQGLEDTAYINFQFKNDLSAHIHVSWLSPVKMRRSIIAGSKKMILYDDLESSDKVKVFDKGLTLSKTSAKRTIPIEYNYRIGDMFTPAIQNIEALQTQCCEFITAITTGNPTRTPGENGLEVIKIIEAIDMSLKHHGAITKIQ